MTMHGGTDGISVYSSIEGVELRGEMFVGGLILLSGSTTHSLSSLLLNAEIAHHALQKQINAENGPPEEQEIVRQELEARQEMDLAKHAEDEATQKWLAFHRWSYARTIRSMGPQLFDFRRVMT